LDTIIPTEEVESCSTSSDGEDPLSSKTQPLSSADLESLKDLIGVYDPSVDYNVMVDGHGTGLCPPIEQEWDSMLEEEVTLSLGDSGRLSLPSSFDLSTDPCFPEVRSQGGQGSCAAWAVTYYAYGYMEAKDNGWTDASSGNDQHLMSPAFTYNKVNGGYDSGSSLTSNSRIIRDWGVASLATMPYDWHDCSSWGDESAWREAPLHRSMDSQTISFSASTTVDTVKSLVSSGTPVVFAMDAGEYSPGFSDGNYIVSSSEYDSSTITHAQTVVGYNDSISDDGDTGAFRVVNSWGSGWGDEGYYWLTYDAFNEIGYMLCLRYLVDIPDHQPSMIATWEFDPGPVREADFEIGIGRSSSPLDDIEPYYSHNANGYTHQFPQFMCLDITAFQGLYDQGNHDFYMKTSAPSTSGTITSFRIEVHSGGYSPGAYTERSAESPDVPTDNPGTVTNSMDTSEDLTPPSLIISSPSQDELCPTTSVTIHWNGSDSGSGIDHYEVKIDSSSWSNVGTQDHHTFMGLGEGVHDAQVRAFDISGNSATDTVSFQVDSLAPSLEIISPSEGFIDEDHLSVEWEGSDPGSGIDHYEIRRDAGSWNILGLQTEYYLHGLGEGEHTIEVRAYDTAGNSNIDSIIIFVDTIAPSVEFISPSNDNYLDSLDVSIFWSGYDENGVERYLLRVNSGTWMDMGENLSTQLHLEEGDHIIEVMASDPAGNNDTDSILIHLDITSPSVTITSPDDCTLNASSISVEWEGSDHSGIEYYRIRSGAVWTDMGITTSAIIELDDGSHLLEVMAVDRAGNSATDSVNITVDTGPPTVEIIQPSSSFVTQDSIDVSWEGSDLGTGISGYWLELNGQLLLSGTQTSFVLDSLSQGTHHIEVITQDMAGNSGSDDIWLTVDSVSPSVEITCPVEGQEMSLGQFEATWTGSDATSGIDGYWFRVDDGAWVGNGLSNSVSVGVLEDGYHEFYLRARDSAGNIITVSVNFTVWTCELELQITSPIEGSIISSEQIEVIWNFTGSPFGLDHFELRVDEGPWTDVGSQTQHELELLTGEHEVEVKAIDGDDHEVIDSVVFLLDSLPPSLTITAPVEGSFINSSFVVVEWENNDVGSGISNLWIRLDMGEWMDIDGDEHVLTSLTAGSHLVQVRTADAAGNLAEDGVNFTVCTLEIGVEILSPGQGEIFDDRSVHLTWSGTDSGSGIDHFEIRLDDQDWVDVGLENEFQLDGLEDGDHHVTIKIVENSGSNATASVDFTVDTTPPELSITSPSNPLTNSSTITVEWTAEDVNGIDHFSLRMDDEEWVDTVQYRYQFNEVDEGQHTIEVVGFDPLNNSASVSIDVTVDSTSPVVNITSPEQGSILDHVEISVNYTVQGSDQGSFAEFRIDGGNWSPADPDVVGLILESSGEHMVEVRVTDQAGNVGRDRSSFVVDTTPPYLEIMTPEEGELISSTIELTWAVEDTITWIVRLQMSIDGDEWTDVSGGSTVLDIPTDGHHDIVMMAEDAAGNIALAGTNITADFTPPLLTILSPSNGEILGESTFVISWSSNDSTSGIESLAFHTGTEEWQDATGLDSIMTSLIDGEQTVSVRATDRAGNTMSKQVTFLVDSGSPSVHFLSPRDGMVNTTECLLEWEIEDLSTCISSISIDGSSWVDMGNNLSFLAPLDDGTHQISLRVRDIIGHEANASMVLMVDTGSPTVVSRTPQGSDVETNTTIRISFSEPMDVSTVSIDVPGTAGEISWENETAILTFDEGLDFDTRYDVQVVGKDLAGNAMVPLSWSFRTSSTLIICGKVLDSSNRPVANALVSVDGTVSATTNSDGEYTVQTTPGNHVIMISMEGYHGHSVEVDATDGQTVVNSNLESVDQGLPDMDMMVVGIIVAVASIIGLQVVLLRRRNR
jgi:hypothetical protein